MSEAIASPVEEARAAVQEHPVAHQDETGWDEGIEQGPKARAWLCVAVTALVTVFRIARNRGTDVTKVFLVVDRWAAYRWVARGMRQLCWRISSATSAASPSAAARVARSASSCSSARRSCSDGGTAFATGPSRAARSSAA